MSPYTPEDDAAISAMRALAREWANTHEREQRTDACATARDFATAVAACPEMQRYGLESCVQLCMHAKNGRPTLVFYPRARAHFAYVVLSESTAALRMLPFNIDCYAARFADAPCCQTAWNEAEFKKVVSAP